MKNRYNSIAILTSLICTIICLTIHILPISNSMINRKTETQNIEKLPISNDYLSSCVEFHKIEPAFAKRPLTTFIVDSFSKFTTLNIGISFVFINFFILFLVGFLIFHLSLSIGNSTKASTLAIVCFFLSFTILFSFFPSNYSYDEPLQYLFILIAMLSIQKRNWLVFIPSFFIALVARESTIILLPSLALFLISEKGIVPQKYIKRFIVLAIPVLLYILFLYLFLKHLGINKESESDFITRFSFAKYNFQDTEFSNESIISLFLALGIQSYFIFWFSKSSKLSSIENKLIKSFILAFIINSVIVLTTAKARETRLLALPLIFAWPILGNVFITEFQLVKTEFFKSKIYKKWLPILLFLFLCCLSIVISKYIYTPTEPDRPDNLFHEYLSISLVLISSHFLIRSYRFKIQ